MSRYNTHRSPSHERAVEIHNTFDVVLYLRHLLHAFRGNERLALAAWYQGERAVREHGVYPESKPFVANVLALRARM